MSGAPDRPPAPAAATTPASVSSPSREIVVFVAMSPARPELDGEPRDRLDLVVGQVGGDLDQQRRAARGIPHRFEQRRSVSTACSPRRPGVFGDDTFTTR